jgi:hypothetical protein
MLKNELIQLLTNQQPIPSVYNEGFSQYEDILFLINLTNQLITNMNVGSDEIENLTKQQLDIPILKSELDKIAKGEYANLYIDALGSYIDNNLYSLVDKIAQFVTFGLDDNGYFIAYIPETWTSIDFSTSENGELVLNY